jgi:chromodomain-helicase-DNA-binding protein 4
MELRKSLCHPYLVNDELEPRNVTAKEAHQNLTDACAKFVLLARMLPKLKAAGHRVLIFSQFKLTLTILERFLAGLDLKYLRLDGDTPQIERQRDVDRFNAPGSEFFAYLLSTRAGGVGLNITSADVIIMCVLTRA